MKSPMLGLRTVINIVPDLAKATAWYTEAFQAEPYFNEPFYVGFNIGGYELGLMPEDKKSVPRGENVLTYWGIESEEELEDNFNRLIKLGCREHEKPTNVGGPVMVASVKDPWGNIIGLIYNPEFKG